MSNLKKEMDAWIKKLNKEIGDLPLLRQEVDMAAKLLENQMGMIDHNYSLISEIRGDIRKLKEELSALRMIQILHLRTDINTKKADTLLLSSERKRIKQARELSNDKRQD